MHRRDCRVVELQLQGYRLATAEIIYRLPDHPSLLQSYIWQDYDLPPRFPELHRFLDFWTENLDGALHSVQVTSAARTGSTRMRNVNVSYRLH